MQEPSILYLGLTPPEGVIHYPVIRTEKIVGKRLEEAKQLWPKFTHVLFTSKTAVRYWEEDLQGKVVVAIGGATAAEVRRKGVEPLVAKRATQEGMVELLEGMDLGGAYLFLPHSKRARMLLQTKVRCFVLDLYDTVLQKLEPVPDLDQVGEIVFTSPSTVEGFLQIWGKLPKDKKLTAIGPITERVLDMIKSGTRDKGVWTVLQNQGNCTKNLLTSVVHRKRQDKQDRKRQDQ